MSEFNDITQHHPLQDKLLGDTASTPTTLPKQFLDLPLPVAQAGTAASAPRKKRKMPRIDHLRVYWAYLLKHIGAESPSTSSAIAEISNSQIGPRTDDDPDADEVDEIVVDRDWTEDIESSVTVNHSERPQEKSGCDSHVTHVGTGTSTTVSHESSAILDHDAGLLRQFLFFLRWEVWPAVYNFFDVQFYDQKTEKQYQKERWFIRKVLYFLKLMATLFTSSSVFSTLVSLIFHRQLGHRSINNCPPNHYPR